jgi:hypothetical protein
MSGGSFSGGSFSGGSFSGMGGSASGTSNMGINGSSMLPGLSGTIPGVGTSTQSTYGSRGGFTGGTGGVSQYNPFGGYYANPLAIGYPSTSSGYGTTSHPFGQPIYTLTTGIGGQYGTTGTVTITNPATGFSATSIGVRRAPAYTTTIGFEHQAPAVTRLTSEVQQVLAQSTRLSTTRDIQVTSQGRVIVLSGWVADAHDRRLAENLARLTPGIHEVRNELKIQEMAPAPRPIR